MSNELKIPEDLRKLYDLAKEAAHGEWCSDWCYSAIRHVVRNAYIECGTHPDGDCASFGKYDGPYIAYANPDRIISLIHRLVHVEASHAELVKALESVPCRCSGDSECTFECGRCTALANAAKITGE